MISALGHCEDPQCAQAASRHELVRLFRCTIHCDRLLCLYHLNAHDVYYEEEKKQNAVVVNELQNSLTLYQSIFEQHLAVYRELVHQASTLLLQNTSALVPIEQIRPLLERLQNAIAVFQQEKVVIKSESVLDAAEFELEKTDSNPLKEQSAVKMEAVTPLKVRPVLRLERVEFSKEALAERRPHDDNSNRVVFNQHDCSIRCRVGEENLRKSKDSSGDVTIDSISSVADDDLQYSLRSHKSSEEPRPSSPAPAGKKKIERVKKKTEKPVGLKRLQT